MKKILFILLLIPSISFAQINLGVDVGFPFSFAYYGNGAGAVSKSLVFPSLNLGLNAGYRIKYFLEPTVSLNYVNLNEGYSTYKKNFNFSAGVRGSLIKKPLTPIYKVGVGYNFSTINGGNYSTLPKDYKSNNLIISFGLGAQYNINKKIGVNAMATNFMTSQNDKLLTGTYNLKYYYIVPSVGITYFIHKKEKK